MLVNDVPAYTQNNQMVLTDVMVQGGFHISSEVGKPHMPGLALLKSSEMPVVLSARMGNRTLCRHPLSKHFSTVDYLSRPALNTELANCY